MTHNTSIADKRTGMGTGSCLCGKGIPKSDNWCSDECYLPWLEAKKLTVFGPGGHKTTADKTPDTLTTDTKLRTDDSTPAVWRCEGCATPLSSSLRGPKKRFCSDACRKRVSRG